jgi:hypothetical protein
MSELRRPCRRRPARPSGDPLTRQPLTFINIEEHMRTVTHSETWGPDPVPTVEQPYRPEAWALMRSYTVTEMGYTGDEVRLGLALVAAIALTLSNGAMKWI